MNLRVPFPAIGVPLLIVVLASACGGSSGLKSELVTEANFPVALTFAPDGRLFYTEKGGSVRIVGADGVLQPEPFVTIENVAQGVEWGLLGIALDPEFASNGYVYVYYTQSVSVEPTKVAKPVVLRLTDVDNRGVDPAVIVDGLPETDPEHGVGAHVGGNLSFGRRGRLYISIGDMEVEVDAQDLSTARGSILRVNRSDGSAPADNPFVEVPRTDPRIFAFGFRNPFEFTFHPETGRLYTAENGPFFCDKLVLVEAGANYGWPNLDAFCNGSGPSTTPLYLYALPGKKGTDQNSGVGPTGLQFVSGGRYPSLEDSLLACEWNTGVMRRLMLGGPDLREVEADDIVVRDCHLDIAISPDGIIYYANDTEIRRLVPSE